jgi:hypothetical protein
MQLSNHIFLACYKSHAANVLGVNTMFSFARARMFSEFWGLEVEYITNQVTTYGILVSKPAYNIP